MTLFKVNFLLVDNNGNYTASVSDSNPNHLVFIPKELMEGIDLSKELHVSISRHEDYLIGLGNIWHSVATNVFTVVRLESFPTGLPQAALDELMA